MFDPQALELAPEFRIIRSERSRARPHALGREAVLALGLGDGLHGPARLPRHRAGGGAEASAWVGQCALRAALRYPERVKAFVLLGTRATREESAAAGIYLDMARICPPRAPSSRSSTSSPAVFGEPFPLRTLVQPAGACSSARTSSPPRCPLIGSDDIYKQLKDIRCSLHHPPWVRRISAFLRARRAAPPDDGGPILLRSISGAAHAANLTHPHAVNPPLLEFLAPTHERDRHASAHTDGARALSTATPYFGGLGAGRSSSRCRRSCSFFSATFFARHESRSDASFAAFASSVLRSSESCFTFAACSSFFSPLGAAGRSASFTDARASASPRGPPRRPPPPAHCSPPEPPCPSRRPRLLHVADALGGRPRSQRHHLLHAAPVLRLHRHRARVQRLRGDLHVHLRQLRVIRHGHRQHAALLADASGTCRP